MAFENLVKIARNFTDTTVKKTGEQVRITKLSMEKAGLEKEADALYAKIGRHCFELHQRGESLDETIDAFCIELSTLADKVAEIETRIDAHKVERDGARYRVRFEEESASEPEIEIEIEEEDEGCAEIADAVKNAIDTAEETAEEVAGAAAEAVEEAAEAAENVVSDAAEKVAGAAQDILGE